MSRPGEWGGTSISIKYEIWKISLASHAHAAPLRSTVTRQPAKSMVKLRGDLPRCRLLESSLWHHRPSQDALFYKTPCVLVLPDGSCGEPKAQEEMDRAAADAQAKVKSWVRGGKHLQQLLTGHSYSPCREQQGNS